ncbi:MAG: hypothetical protein Q4F67_17190, partial [Propionibacteriaceae bacterium]|nr:hypothetical protein [Propionibacteriaceae bacterium]
MAALTCVGIFLLRDGALGLASAGLAAAMVVLFYTVGQWVQVQVADAPAQTVFRASVGSYIARVAALGGVLFVYLSYADAGTRLLAAPLVIAPMAVINTVGP